MISKEVLIVTGIMLVMLFLGAGVYSHFDFDKSNVITGATVIDVEENEITGAVVSVMERSSGEGDEIIGEYSITPVFIVDIENDLEKEYGEFRVKARNFKHEIDSCYGDMDVCIADRLDDEEYIGWKMNEECEKEDEIFFYDFVNVFEECVNSVDVDCLCEGRISEKSEYGDGIYYLDIYSGENHVDDEKRIVFALSDYGLSVTFSGIELFVNEGYVERGNFFYQRNEDIGFDIVDSDEMIYLYKDQSNSLVLLSTDDYNSIGNDMCVLDNSVRYKFCDNEGHMFAIDLGS